MLCGVVVAVVVHMRQGTGDGPTGCCADGSGVLPRGLLVTLPWWFLRWVICMSAPIGMGGLLNEGIEVRHRALATGTAWAGL